MKKYLSVVLSVAMILSLCACSKSSVPQVEETNQIEEIVTTPIEESPEQMLTTVVDPKFTEIMNTFELRDTDLCGKFTGMNDVIANDYPGFIETYTWNDSSGYASIQYFYSEEVFDFGTVKYGILSNEDFSRLAVSTITLINCDESKFDDFLVGLDWHPQENPYDESSKYYGYIGTWDSFVTVANVSTYSDLMNRYGKTEYMPAETDTIIELTNIGALAYVLGINIDSAIANCDSIMEINSIQTNLENAAYYGVRGYDQYLDINGFGVIISEYDALVYALMDTEHSDLCEVAYLSSGSGSDPTSDPNSPYYEPPVNPIGNGSNNSSASNYPPKVKEYLSYGYEVYKHNFCDAFYYKESWNNYVRFYVSNALVAGAWANSVADYSYSVAVGNLTRIY